MLDEFILIITSIFDKHLGKGQYLYSIHREKDLNHQYYTDASIHIYRYTPDINMENLTNIRILKHNGYKAQVQYQQPFIHIIINSKDNHHLASAAYDCANQLGFLPEDRIWELI